MDNIWRERRSVKKNHTARTYDVRVTLNKNGSGGFVVRFGFLNYGYDVVKAYTYIEPSSVLKLKGRIYFRLSNEKEEGMFKITSSSVKGLYFTFTPTPQEEKKYRALWISKTFEMKYDVECGLYYIEVNENDI